MSQNHLAVAFPLKSPADAKALPETLASMMPDFFKAADATGTVHYSRFTVLSDKSFLFLADFDGEFGQLIGDLASHAGTVFDTIFEHVPDPRPRRYPIIRMPLQNGLPTIRSAPHTSTALIPDSQLKKSRIWPRVPASRARASCFRSW